MGIMKKSVNVLLSTYNGEQYIREQLESIYQQTYQEFEIYIRDDGSNDLTHQILTEYQQKHSNFCWYSGENVGISNSMFQLMKSMKNEEAIYVFADQDDVWTQNRLERIITMAESCPKDLAWLYCGEVEVVDEQLGLLRKNVFSDKIYPSFGNALVENICIGCTSAMNDVLFRKILEHVPDYTVMYDWWFYLAAAGLGTVFFDKLPLIKYRQHSCNLVGTSSTARKKFISRMRNFYNHKNQIYKQANEFKEQHAADLSKADLEILFHMIEYRDGWKKTYRLIKNPNIFRQNLIDNIIFKILFLIHYV